MKIFIVVLFLVCAGVLFAQTGYVHTTNTVVCEMVDNGIIGDNTSGTYSGLIYLGGSNVIYSGGIAVTLILPTGTPEVMGMSGSYDLNDFVNVEPFTGFISDTNFDQIGKYTFTSPMAPGNSYVTTFSRNDQSVIYLRQTTVSTITVPTLVAHVGLILDFDIGDYANNSGGYDPQRNLIYMYDASPSPSDTNYYGVVLLNVEPNSLHGKLIKNYNATNEDIANYCINTDFSTPPDTADQRLHISMPGNILQAGETGQWDFAIVCGTSLTDLQNTADIAKTYGEFLLVSIDDNLNELPAKYSLQQNYPNPFNPSTRISWQLPVSNKATLKIFNILGKEVATLVNEYKPAGKYETEFNAANLPSGVYFYQLKAGEFLQTRKMLLLK
jgi:hypothetical protein